MGFSRRFTFITLATAGYAVLASLWILLSDRLLELMVEDGYGASPLASLKGLTFVVVTAAGLFLLLRHATPRRPRQRRPDTDRMRTPC